MEQNGRLNIGVSGGLTVDNDGLLALWPGKDMSSTEGHEEKCYPLPSTGSAKTIGSFRMHKWIGSC